MAVFGIAVFIVILVLVFGKTQEWEYEAKLLQEGDMKIRGEVEIEKYKKENPTGEISLYDVGDQLPGTYEVLVNDQPVSQFRWESNSKELIVDFPQSMGSKRLKRVGKINHKFFFPVLESLRVSVDDRVEVRLPDGKALKGVFVPD